MACPAGEGPCLSWCLTVPVLQLVGSEGTAGFLEGTEALDARLVHGRVEVIAGARHAAHHSHPEAFLAAVERFLAS